MKSYFKLFIIFVILTSIMLTFLGCEKPLMGYDLVKWGTSVDDVRKAYNIGSDIVLNENFGDDPNIASLIQNISGSENIIQREFLFNKWNSKEYKLYRVWVYYDYHKTNIQDLQTVLTNNFGISTDTKSNSEDCEYSWPISDSIEITIFGKYSPELLIELIHSKCNYNRHNYLAICYTWQKFRDEYRASNISL